MIFKCPNCKPHAFQDKQYGERVRVQNECKPGDKSENKNYRCTVCGAINRK